MPQRNNFLLLNVRALSHQNNNTSNTENTNEARIGASTANNNRMEWKASIKSEADREGEKAAERNEIYECARKSRQWKWKEKNDDNLSSNENDDDVDNDDDDDNDKRRNGKNELNLPEKRPVTLHFVFRLSFEPLFQNGLVLIKHTRGERKDKSEQDCDKCNLLYKISQNSCIRQSFRRFWWYFANHKHAKKAFTTEKTVCKLLATVANMQQTQNFYRNPKYSQ